MGLDIAEFMIAIEEEFQIDILESDAQNNIDTLEHLVTYLEEKTAKAPHSQTEADRVFQEGFLSLRRFFANELEVEISQLTPETEIAPLLIPLAKRRRIWKKIRKEFSYRVPSLSGKIFIEWIGGLCVFLGFFFGLFVTIGLDNDIPSLALRGLTGFGLGIGSGCVLFLILLLLFSPLFSTIPKDCRTLGGLAKSAVVTSISLDPNGQVWTRQTITEAILHLTSIQTGIPVEKISLTDKFVNLFF